jgi:Lrp/AsnC family leucine-responsive transcriptional regulator
MFLGSKPVPDAVGATVKRVPDVLECHLVAGTADYLLKVVAQMHSSFALRTVFKTTALPV